MVDNIPPEVGFSKKEKEVTKQIFADPKNTMSLIHTVKNEYPATIHEVKSLVEKAGFVNIEFVNVYQSVKILKRD